MTQRYLGQITDTTQESGDDLAARLNAFDSAHKTNQSGTTRPGGIQAGGIWSRDLGNGVYALMLYDGSGDRLIGYSGLSPAANRLPYFTSGTAMALTTLSAFGRSLIDDADANAALSTLGASAAGAAAFRGEPAPNHLDRDFNNLTARGEYTVSQEWANSPPGYGVVTGIARVSRRAFSAGAVVAQTLYLGTTDPEIWHRHGTGDPVTWSRWQRVALGDPLPVGSVIHLAGNSPPEGYLKANGAAVSRSSYADLFSAIGTTYGAGNGSSTFNLPDLRGEFIRGLDDGRGVDGGRTLGSAQPDQMQRITGSLTFPRNYSLHSNTDRSGAFTLPENLGSTYANSTSGSARNLGFDSALSPGARAGDETRPRNVALLACIKY